MSDFSVYTMILDRTAKMFAPHVPKKKRRGESFLQWVVKSSVQSSPQLPQSMEFAVMLDEFAVIDGGSTMAFLESKELVEMLWNAKMDVDLEDLDLSVLPRGFMVSWPNMEVDGVQLRGCMVWIGRIAERDRCIKRYTKKYVGQEMSVEYDDSRKPEELAMSICYSKDTSKAPMYIRCTVPQSMIKDVISSEDGIKALGSYDTGMLGAIKVSEQETKEQYVMSKLVVRMLAYATACPQFVVNGFPSGMKAKTFSSRNLGKKTGVVMSYPMGDTSKKAHWRGCHIRSYPKRKDGSKKTGVVFVAGTMVNSEVEPVTVKESV